MLLVALWIPGIHTSNAHDCAFCEQPFSAEPHEAIVPAAPVMHRLAGLSEPVECVDVRPGGRFVAVQLKLRIGEVDGLSR